MKYRIIVERSGYCRGNETWEVEANNMEEAKEIYWDGGGDLINEEIIRDDREGEFLKIELIPNPANQLKRQN